MIARKAQNSGFGRNSVYFCANDIDSISHGNGLTFCDTVKMKL